MSPAVGDGSHLEDHTPTKRAMPKGSDFVLYVHSVVLKEKITALLAIILHSISAGTGLHADREQRKYSRFVFLYFSRARSLVTHVVYKASKCMPTIFDIRL